MQSLSFEEENIIKDIRNLFRLKKEVNYTAIKYLTNLFRLEKESKVIKDRDIKNLFVHEEEKNHYKPIRVSNFGVTIILIVELMVIKIEKLSVEEYLN